MRRHTRKEVEAIRQGIIDATPEHPQDLVPTIASQFNLTPKTVHHHLANLRKRGIVQVSGSRRVPRYELKPLRSAFETRAITVGAEEHHFWRSIVSPILDAQPIRPNIREICEYGVSEMVNNVIDHSESPTVAIGVEVTAADINLVVSDQGIGIFNKIQRDCALADPREAVLELAKGKLTTAPSKHTGEGIFFTSRLFDRFFIFSGILSLISRDGEDWMFDNDVAPMGGTYVRMLIKLATVRTKQEIFSKFSDPQGITFSRTHVPVILGKYPGDSLVSRSQARRIVARFEKFREVWLDFRSVDTIGPAFADEIFRVFQAEHPDLHLWAVNANPAVEAMVERARGTQQERNDEAAERGAGNNAQ